MLPPLYADRLKILANTRGGSMSAYVRKGLDLLFKEIDEKESKKK